MRRTFLAALTFLAMTAVPALANDGAKLLDDAFVKAFKANDVKATTGLYAKDAVLYPTDGPAAKGSDAIQQYYAALFDKDRVMDFAITESHYFSIGRLSTGWGTWTMTLVPKATGSPVIMTGRFTDVARNDNGYWFYIVDHASLQPAPGKP